MQRILMPVLSLIGLVVLCLLCLQCHGPQLEADLIERGRQQLVAAGLDPAILAVDGRDAILVGAAKSEAARDRAGKLVAEVRGIRVVDNRLTLDSLSGSGGAAGASTSQLVRSDDDPGSVDTGSGGDPGSGSDPGSGRDPASSIDPASSSDSGAGSDPGSASELQTSLDTVLRNGNVEFATNSDELTTRGRAVLDEIYLLLAAHPETRIAISGHSDLTGRAAYNLELSKLRAQAARDYLVGRGLPTERFNTEGYGATRPIADNDAPEGRQKNRRIEFHVLEAPQ